MSNTTVFLNMLVSQFQENTPDPFFARWSEAFSQQIRYNCVVKRTVSLALANGGSYTLSPSNLALSDWNFILAKVIGTARLNTAGKDTDGTTDIAGKLDGYGTAIYPGFIILSTYNLIAMTVTAQADNTVVEIFYCKSQDG